MRHRCRRWGGIAVIASLVLVAGVGAAEERIEGKVVGTKLTACAFKPGTCEGSLTLETRGTGRVEQVTVKVPRGTSITKGSDHLFLSSLKGSAVAIAYVVEQGDRVARSIEVKAATP